MLAPDIQLDDIDLSLGAHRVLRCLNTTFGGGRWHSILGRSGCGKSSLLRLVAGLQTPQAGRLSIGGADVMGQACNNEAGRRIAFMAQDDGLLPWLSIRQNVQLGPWLRRESLSLSAARVNALLRQVGLEPWADALPAALSGGMRQRVALARTLLEDRPIVLMDEPFSRLDAITRDELQSLSASLLAGRTVLLVTHDPVEALRLSHELHVFEPGDTTRLHRLTMQSSPLRAMDDPELVTHLPSLWQRLRAAHDTGSLAA